jgi:uncharacterized membrane protein SpoIIM required for sporulation
MPSLSPDLTKWERLADLIRRVEDHGLRALPVAEVEEVSRLYRQATAALARERTRGRDPELADYLNSLVARAHSSIYGRSTQPGLRLGHFFAVEIPRTCRAHLAWIGLAAGLLALFALLAYGLVTSDERWGAALSPAAAEAATKFAESHQPAGRYFAPTAGAVGGGNLSAFILGNNVKAAFSAFGLGLTAGLGTLVVLYENGVMVGVFLGLGHNHHALLDMIAVVAPHGILELFAFTIAAAGGFVLGFSLVAPGDLTRAESLSRAARRALRLALGAALLLVPAATVEGLLSPQATGLFASDRVRILFGTALAALGLLYLFAGDLILSGERPQTSDSRPQTWEPTAPSESEV